MIALELAFFFDGRLTERHFGVLEGMLQSEIKQADPKTLFTPDEKRDWQGYQLPQNAETIDEVAARALKAVGEALEGNQHERLLFVAHGAWFRALAYHLTGGLIISSDNAVPYFCQLTDETWHMHKIEEA